MLVSKLWKIKVKNLSEAVGFSFETAHEPKQSIHNSTFCISDSTLYCSENANSYSTYAYTIYIILVFVVWRNYQTCLGFISGKQHFKYNLHLHVGWLSRQFWNKQWLMLCSISLQCINANLLLDGQYLYDSVQSMYAIYGCMRHTTCFTYSKTPVFLMSVIC